MMSVLAATCTRPLARGCVFRGPVHFRSLSDVSGAHEDKAHLLDKASSLPSDLADSLDHSLPHGFADNQNLAIDDETKKHLRQLLWEFRAPVRYAVAYGSGIFTQGNASAKPSMIDLIFGVSHTQHFHSLNLRQNRHHYSFMGSLGSEAVSYVQDKMGAGVYFNPYVDIKGTMIKYGVVSIETLCKDLSEWDSLYLAGRLQKPVKILRDDAAVRVANQINLISAVRVALMLLPETFSERTLYKAIAGISYMGDPRMRFFAENPHKVDNIVGNQIPQFRHLYGPLIDQLPNVSFVKPNTSADASGDDVLLEQDMDPVRRGNMVCRLPKAFREKLYFQYQRKFSIPALEFEKMVGLTEDEERMKRKLGGDFEQRIAKDTNNIRQEVSMAIKSTVAWPSSVQSLKGLVTAGPVKSFRYLGEKVEKRRKSQRSVPKNE